MGGYTGIPVPIFEKRIQIIAQYVRGNHLDGAFFQMSTGRDLRLIFLTINQSM